MKKIIFLFLIMCCFISMTACSKDEIIEQYIQALQALPDTGLTDKKELQGKRSPGTDSYVGTYEANYEDFSGEEVLFGGTALERDGGNEIEISCHMDTESGTFGEILSMQVDFGGGEEKESGSSVVIEKNQISILDEEPEAAGEESRNYREAAEEEAVRKALAEQFSVEEDRIRIRYG